MSSFLQSALPREPPEDLQEVSALQVKNKLWLINLEKHLREFLQLQGVHVGCSLTDHCKFILSDDHSVMHNKDKSLSFY